MTVEELKPKRRRGVDPDERKAELEAEGTYTTPLRDPEPFEGLDPAEVIEQDRANREQELDTLIGAARVLGDSLTDEGQKTLTHALADALQPRGLHAKLAEMLAEIGHVQKTGQAPSGMGGFKFTEASHLAEIIRGSLAEKHISMLPEHQEIAESTEFKSASNKTQFLVTVKTTWRLTDADTGETVTFESFGSGQDNSDKAFPKAMTNSMKYAMLMGWLVPQGDDPERFQNEEKAPEQTGDIKIEASNIEGVKQGGRQTKVTEPQINAIRARARALNLDPGDLRRALETVLGTNFDAGWPDDNTEQINFLLVIMNEMTFEQAANVLSVLNAAEA